LTFIESLILTLGGVAFGAVVTYLLTSRQGQRDLEAAAVELLEEALTEMQVYALNSSSPWQQSLIQPLVEDGQRALARSKLRLDGTQGNLVVRVQRAMAVFSLGGSIVPAAAGNFEVCLRVYVDQAFTGIRDFYDGSTVSPSTLPSGASMRESKAADPTLAALREAVVQ